MEYVDPVVTRGLCAACGCEGTEDNKSYYFDYWKIDLCKSCFIQLSTKQIMELKADMEKQPIAGYIRQSWQEVMDSMVD